MNNEDLIKIAETDIRASKILYDNKLYTQALFYFQQSVEKVSKYIGLQMACISESMLKNISHDPTKVFAKMFSHLSNKCDGVLPPINPHEITNAKQIVQQTDEHIATAVLKQNINEIIKAPNPINTYGKSEFDAVIDYISTLMPDYDLGLDNPLLRKYTEVKLQEQTHNIIIYINIGQRLLLLLMLYSLFLSRYKVDDFRYLSESFGNPINYFNDEHAFVIELKNHIYIMSSYIIPNSLNITWC
jgi:hypothetical protein